MSVRPPERVTFSSTIYKPHRSKSLFSTPESSKKDEDPPLHLSTPFVYPRRFGGGVLECAQDTRCTLEIGGRAGLRQRLCDAALAGYSVWVVEINQPVSINVVRSEDKKEL